MHRVIALALACAATAGLVSAVPISAAGPTTRTVYVTVVDDKGRAVPGLTPADFVLKEGGKACEIASVAPASEKMRLALMVEHPLVGQTHVRNGLAEFVTRMFPSAEIALFMVTQRAEKLVEFTSNPNVLVDGIRNLPSEPGPAERSRARCDLRSGEAVRKGEAGASGHRARDRRAGSVDRGGPGEHPQPDREEQGAVLDGVDRAGEIAARPKVNSLRDFAGRTQIIGDGPRQSGGRRVPILTLPGFETGLQQVADDLSSQYLITYILPDGVRASDRISVSLKRPGTTLRSPTRVPK